MKSRHFAIIGCRRVIVEERQVESHNEQQPKRASSLYLWMHAMASMSAIGSLLVMALMDGRVDAG